MPTAPKLDIFTKPIEVEKKKFPLKK